MNDPVRNATELQYPCHVCANTFLPGVTYTIPREYDPTKPSCGKVVFNPTMAACAAGYDSTAQRVADCGFCKGTGWVKERRRVLARRLNPDRRLLAQRDATAAEILSAVGISPPSAERSISEPGEPQAPVTAGTSPADAAVPLPSNGAIALTYAKMKAALKELLRLYDWRNELGRIERDFNHNKKQMTTWLNQYGREKKQAWNVARDVLASAGDIDVLMLHERIQTEAQVRIQSARVESAREVVGSNLMQALREQHAEDEGKRRHADCRPVCQRSISRGGDCIGRCDLLDSSADSGIRTK